MLQIQHVPAITLFVCLTANGQTPTFDVASIHPSGPEANQEGKNKTRPHHIHITPGNVVIRNASMREILGWAYNATFYQIAGPDWINTAQFDIVAKAPNTASEDEMRPMMQSLLTGRFGLAIHRIEKEMNCMALLQGKDGAKLTPSKDEGESLFQGGNNKPIIHFGRMSMQEFATLLSEPMQKPVVDMTGLKGRFDFTLDASNYVPPEPAPGQPREHEDESYMVVRALQDQIGLRLEPRKLNINQIVVDHLEKVPTEN